MKVGEFEFNLRELAGSMGDFGTLFPLAIGYIAVCGMDPAGLLVMMGLANIITGIVYRLPMPIEPKKVLAVTAIAQKWPPSLIYASGFGTGVIWLLLAGTGLIDRVARLTPKSVVRGIQLTLGVLLAIEGFKMVSTGWALGVASVIIILGLRGNRYAPAAIVLVALGLGVMAYKGELSGATHLNFSPPTIRGFTLQEVWKSLVLGGFAQVALTTSNAVIATAALIEHYFPGRPVSERKLSLNMGIMNTVVPFFGGMPMCHGAGGLAGQYYFGARTGGTNIIEGVLEISLGLFMGASIAKLLGAFPLSVIGAMMFLVGIELTKFVKDLRWEKDLIPAGVTALMSLIFNMAVGFVSGVLVYHAIRQIFRFSGRCSCNSFYPNKP
jgi:xanthine/uracil/vitamin C permease (AzgA family)